MFRFLIQPQLNTVAQSVLGYELLIKQYRDGAWRMPKSFSAIPAKTMADTLIATVKELSLKVGSVSVNVDRHQIQDQHLIHALIMAQAVLRPVKLVIELIEDAVNPAVTNQELIPTVQNLNDLGIQFCLDDVGSGINTWPEIKSLLPYTSELKYALQNYKEHLSEPTPNTTLRSGKKSPLSIRCALFLKASRMTKTMLGQTEWKLTYAKAIIMANQPWWKFTIATPIKNITNFA